MNKYKVKIPVRGGDSDIITADYFAIDVGNNNLVFYVGTELVASFNVWESVDKVRDEH
jgi:hypothetical protein